jgi:arsenate reductase-like glutaredoxin family protein
MSNVQIFGTRNSAATRAAERFFKERRAAIQFVDLKKKPMSPGEIRRFVERFGLARLLDTESAAFIDAGLRYMKMPESELLDRVARDPALLRLPLVRSGNLLTFGQDEAGWKSMLPAPSSAR